LRGLPALAATLQQNYIPDMDTTPARDNSAHTPRPETADEQKRRLAWEAEKIAEARAELDAGLYVDSAEMDAWMNSLDTDHELPPPPTRHR
jgi:predicted transcriptional regulator